jgi:hypothetical protein
MLRRNSRATIIQENLPCLAGTGEVPLKSGFRQVRLTWRFETVNFPITLCCGMFGEEPRR